MQLSRTAMLPLLAAFATGCATAQEYWTHNSLTGPIAQQQLTADHGTCTANAYRTVGNPPNPPTSSTQPAQTGRYVDIYTPNGPVMGYVHPTTPPSAGNPFLEGWQQGEARTEYQNRYNSIYYGCMAASGWTLHRR